MLIEQKCTVPVPLEPLWGFLVDAAAVSRCMPGVESFAESGADEYEGCVRVKVGPISLRLQGRLVVHERDALQWTARMSAEGKDSRIAGAVAARLTMSLTALDGCQTELNVVTDATILGKLGEFGQPMMRKTADRIMQQFVRNIIEAMSDGAAGAPATLASKKGR